MIHYKHAATTVLFPVLQYSFPKSQYLCTRMLCEGAILASVKSDAAKALYDGGTLHTALALDSLVTL